MGSDPLVSEVVPVHRPDEAQLALPERARVPWFDVGCIALCACFVAGWCWAATGEPSISVAAVALAAFSVFYALGDVACSWRRLWRGIAPSFPLKLLVGYAVANTVLFAVTWFFLPALRVFFIALGVGSVVAIVLRARRRHAAVAAEPIPAFLAVALSLVAATLWAQDCLSPTEVHGTVTIFRPWVDSFFHATQIARMGGEQVAGRMQDVQLAFVPARFYHYASYVTPVLLRAFSSLTAYGAYAGVLVPMGIFMTGIAAYTLASSWWGAWPGFAATAALLVLPDAAAQGTRNGFMAYHWMQNVGATGMYGVAVLALAWTLVLRGCAERSWVQVVAGWMLAAVVIVYKAQFFVAASLLLWLYPAAAMRGVTAAKRAAWLVGAILVYLGALFIAARVPSFPLIRPDGSSARHFVAGLLMSNTEPGAFRALFAPHLDRYATEVEVFGFGAVYLLLCAVGLFAVAYAALALRLRNRVGRPIQLFPALVLLNFVLMGLVLAYDERGIGTPEELLHRPFVWAYFITATWVGGAFGVALLQKGAPWRRVAFAACSAALLIVPARHGASGIQNKEGSSMARVPIPTAVVELAQFVREHAPADDIVQDSALDPYVVLSALTERNAFVIRYWSTGSFQREEIAARADLVRSLLEIPDERVLGEVARRYRIRWLMLRPKDVVSWPASVLDRPAFSSAGYRLYQLY